MYQQLALIPYWLKDDPFNIESSDHLWWFKHLLSFDKLVFAGPFIKTEQVTTGNRTIFKFQTQSLLFDLREIFLSSQCPDWLSLDKVTMYWHVMENSATCRVTGLELIDCAKVAVIGDTHHMNNPISGLYGYLQAESFSYICCSHNQYNPLFTSLLKIKALDFPFSARNISNNLSIDKSETSLDINYYGSLVSFHHYHRSKIVNKLLASHSGEQVTLQGRSPFAEWEEKLKPFQAVLTCSLNGTFSFQTFLPMAYGNCLLTDPISEANWIGESLKHKVNCLIYNDDTHLIDLIKEIRIDKEKMEKLGIAAKDLVNSKLQDAERIRVNWKLREKGWDHRTRTTLLEEKLLTTSNICIDANGNFWYGEAIKIFEQIQELHRIFWKIGVRFVKSFPIGSDPSCINESYIEKLFIDILQILPRCEMLETTVSYGIPSLKICIFANSRKILSIEASHLV